jgi:hypothetical protein
VSGYNSGKRSGEILGNLLEYSSSTTWVSNSGKVLGSDSGKKLGTVSDKGLGKNSSKEAGQDKTCKTG